MLPQIELEVLGAHLVKPNVPLVVLHTELSGVVAQLLVQLYHALLVCLRQNTFNFTTLNLKLGAFLWVIVYHTQNSVPNIFSLERHKLVHRQQFWNQRNVVVERK